MFKREKKEDGIGYFWCKPALASEWGGKGEGINRMAERSTDDCIWIGLFPAQDYRFREGISLWLLFLAATNVCIAMLKCSKKIVLSVFASTSSSVIEGEVARRQHHVKTSCGERQGGCRGWDRTKRGRALVSSYWTSAVKPSSPLAKQKHHWEYNSACWVVQHVQDLPAGAWVANLNAKNFW